MNNRLDSTIDPVECIRMMSEDIRRTYPTDQLELIRDNKRISQQFSSRGLSFFTIDLPEIAKELDLSLSLGRLSLSCNHTRSYRKGSKIPRLFKGLWIRIFEEDGRLREEPDKTAIYFLRSVLLVFKKSDVMYSPRSLYETVGDFINADESLPPTPPFWNEADLDPSSAAGHLCDLADVSVDRDLLSYRFGGSRKVALLEHAQRVADHVAGSLGEFLPSEVFGKHGPGAVSELPVSKYKFHFEKWSPFLEPLFPFDEFAVANLSLVESTYDEYDSSLEEEASRLIAVPKTAKGPRLIAAEPLCNQWIQQGVAKVLIDRISRSPLRACIDIFDQVKSRSAALNASATGREATIDLKAASDKLSCYVVQRIFRRNFSLLEMLRATRTRFMLNAVDSKQQSILRLRKFATMGSALTFPLQSIVFAILCLAAGSFQNRRHDLRTLAKKVRVYGDDLIVPIEWVPDVVTLLESLHLEVSKTKTFTKGNFRESCGLDCFAGEDVTPPRIRTLKRVALGPAEIASWLDVANNFFLKGYWYTSAWMIKTVPQIAMLPVVSFTAGTLGLSTFNATKENSLERYLTFIREVRPIGLPSSCETPGSSRKNFRVPIQTGKGISEVPLRWNRQLQRYEVRIQSLSERKKSEPGTPGGPSFLLEYLSREDRRNRKFRRYYLREDSERDLASARMRHMDTNVSVLGLPASRLDPNGKRVGGISSSLRWVPLSDILS